MSFDNASMGSCPEGQCEGKLAIAGVFGGVSVDKTLQDMQALIDSLK